MWLKRCLFICVAVEAVKIDMKGSINVGKDVANVIADYFKDEFNSELSGRRMDGSMNSTFNKVFDVIRQMKFCKGLTFCTDQKESLLLDYLLALTNTVRSVFDGALEDQLCMVKDFLKSAKLVKKVVKGADSENEVYTWTNVLKKTSASFLEKAVKLVDAASNVVEGKQAITTLKQRLVIGINKVEKEYQDKLCRDFRICSYQFDVSINLQLLLNSIKTLNDTRVFFLLQQFKNNFLRAPIFKELDDQTMKNFEDILTDMMTVESFGKEIILSITDVVQKRLSLIELTENDALVLQMILADVDHLYINKKDEPIETFIDVFKQWLKSRDDSILGPGMEKLYNGLASHFSDQPPELIFKLKTEAQVFLELTVGSAR